MAVPESEAVIINTNYLARRINLEERVQFLWPWNDIGLCTQGNSIESFINEKFAVMAVCNEGYTY